jgi:hypothetical protein
MTVCGSLSYNLQGRSRKISGLIHKSAYADHLCNRLVAWERGFFTSTVGGPKALGNRSLLAGGVWIEKSQNSRCVGFVGLEKQAESLPRGLLGGWLLDAGSLAPSEVFA